MLADGLWYANGVELAKDESFVAVVETMSAAVHKYHLKGPKVLVITHMLLHITRCSSHLLYTFQMSEAGHMQQVCTSG